MPYLFVPWKINHLIFMLKLPKKKRKKAVSVGKTFAEYSRERNHIFQDSLARTKNNAHFMSLPTSVTKATVCWVP